MTVQPQRVYRFIPANSRSLAHPQTAKIYQFPSPAAGYGAEERIDDPRIEEMTARSVVFEVAAAVLSLMFWLAWRLTHVSAGSR